MSNRQGFIKRVTNPFLFRLYALKQIPMLMLAGIKVVELGEEEAITSIRYGYLTKNPFRSIYFACLGMAAELSSGVIAMMHVSDARPRVSMLVTGMKADFMKKATGRIFFSCNEGKKIAAAIAETQKTGEGVTVIVLSKGTDEKGDVVAEFSITWSFRRKAQ
jgi:acyl-coenzyme A thioesterase PaaI-like protein